MCSSDLFAELGGADAIVFSGGIGENAPQVREQICHGLDALGLALDETANQGAVAGAEGPISTVGSRLKAYVIPTNEELLIARDSFRVVRAGAGAAETLRVSRALRDAAAF